MPNLHQVTMTVNGESVTREVEPRQLLVYFLRDQVGLPVTVGIARTKFLAKVASGVAKPDGLLLVPPDCELAFLHPLPVERVWGVGRVTAAKRVPPRPVVWRIPTDNPQPRPVAIRCSASNPGD